ncbi:MAG: methyltransferase [Bacteroides sp.]|nr:methyltransferase [Bacteroides sp.]
MKTKNDLDLPSYPPLFFVRITQNIRLFFLRMNRRFTHPNVVMWEMAHNMWLAAGISVVAELGIADLVKEGPRSVDDLADQTKTHSDSLYRVLRMLASQGIFKEIKGQRFETTSLAMPLQDDQIRYLVLLHLNRNQFRVFGELMESVRSGTTVRKEHSGKALFDHIGNDERKNEWFNKAMTSASKMQVPALLSAFPFQRYRDIMDIGGGEGLFLASVLSKAPKSKGVTFDLPAVLSRTKGIIDKHALTGRMFAVEGDFFDGVPDGGDLYILKSVLHDWDDALCKKILGNVFKAMDQKSRLLVIESVLDEGNHPSFGKMTDILMMVAAGGVERTRTQWVSLLGASGFKIRKIHPTITPHSIIEAEKI